MGITLTKMKRLLAIAAEHETFKLKDLRENGMTSSVEIKNLQRYGIAEKVNKDGLYQFTERFYKETIELQKLVEAIK